MEKKIKLIECPRDAMQGIHEIIDTRLKAAYINLLLQVGFDTIDFGSFVSPLAIPQLKDTKEVLSLLELNSETKLLAIVANLRGIAQAIVHPEINYLGFPFSISPTFQRLNTNSTLENSLATVSQMLEHCDRSGKTAVVYLSMGFGNPYGDEWSAEILGDYAEKLISKGVQILSMADTTGVSTPQAISSLLPDLIRRFPEVEIGLHLHSTPETRKGKIEAAYQSGCRRFDSALKGYGGCPMASDELTGNLATEDLISYFESQNIDLGLNKEKWQEAMAFSAQIFR